MGLGISSLGFESLGLLTSAGRPDYGFAVLAFTPNWSTPVAEKLSWSTSVIESFNGTEQRHGRRDEPRRELSYSILLTDFQAASLENTIYGSPGIAVAVPAWTDPGLLADTVFGGDNILTVSTDGLGLVEGGLALLFESASRFEIVKISEIEEGEVLLAEPIYDYWPAGTRLYQLNYVDIARPFQLTRESAAVITAQLTLRQKTGGGLNLPAAAAPSVFKGFEVLTAKHNWSTSPTSDIDILSTLIDSGVGPTRLANRGKHSTQTVELSVLLKTRSEIAQFRALLARLKGRLTTVWVPSQAADFRLRAAVDDSSVVVPVSGDSFARYTGINTGKNHLRIQLRTGEVFYREVVNVVLISGGAELRLDTALGVDITPQLVKKIDIMVKARLASDDVELRWQTASVAECSLIFRSIV